MLCRSKIFHMKFEIILCNGFILLFNSLESFFGCLALVILHHHRHQLTPSRPDRHPFWYLIAMLIRSDICCWSFGCCCCGDADGAVDFAALVSRWLLPIWLSTSNSYFRLTVLPRIQITIATMQISSAQMAIAPPAIPASSIIIMRDGAAMYEMMGRIMFEIENFALFRAEMEK